MTRPIRCSASTRMGNYYLNKKPITNEDVGAELKRIYDARTRRQDPVSQGRQGSRVLQGARRARLAAQERRARRRA